MSPKTKTKQKLNPSKKEKAPEKHVKVEMPKTMEEAKVVPLTDKERTTLSREQILTWYRTQRLGKLKALHNEIVLKTWSEREKIREDIVKRTADELVKLDKDIPKNKRIEIAEKFSKEVLKVLGEENFEKNWEKLLKPLSQEDIELKMFFAFLGRHGSLRSIKKLEQFKQAPFMQNLFRQQPSLEAEYDKMVDKGDIDQLTDFLHKHFPDLKKIGKEKLYFTFAMLSDNQNPLGDSFTTKIPVLKDIVQGLKAGLTMSKKLKELEYFPFFVKASKKMGVKLTNLMNISGLTLAELRERDRILYKYKYLLEIMYQRTKSKSKERRINRQLDYIEDIHKILKKVEHVRHNNENEIRAGIAKHLDKNKNLKEEDKIRIMNEIDLDSVRIQCYLPSVVYGATGDRINDNALQWIGNLIARGSRLMKAKRFVFGPYSRGRVMSKYILKRYADKSMRELRKLLKTSPGLKRIDKEVTKLGKKIGEYSVAKGTGRTTAEYAQNLSDHDNLIRRYATLSEETSRLLTRRANDVISAGAQLESLIRSGNLPASGRIGKEMLSPEIISALGLQKAPQSIKVYDLHKAYTKRLVELRNMRDRMQDRFATLAGELDNKVIHRFDRRYFSRGREIREVGEEIGKRLTKIERHVVPGKRLLHYGKLLALPVIGASIPLINVMAGNTRARDIKWDLFDTAIGFVPVLGTINDFKQMYQGYTTSGRKLTTRERVLSGVFGVAGAIADVALIVPWIGGSMRAYIGGLRSARRLKQIGVVARGARGARKVEAAVDIAKTARNMSPKKINEFIRLENMLDNAGLLNKLDKVKKGSKYYEAARRYRKLEKISDIQIYRRLLNDADIMRWTGTATRSQQMLRKLSKYVAYGGLAAGGAFFLTGVNPLSEKIRDKGLLYTGKLVGVGWESLGTAAKTTVSLKFAKPPIEEIIQGYVKKRVDLNKFFEEYQKLEKSNDPKKKQKIETLIAKNWHNGHVQTWVYKNKEKFNVKNIYNKITKKIGKARQYLSKYYGRRYANIDRLGTKRGSAGKEIL